MQMQTALRTNAGGNLAQLWLQLVAILQAHVGFGDGINADNIDGAWIGTTTPNVANTDFTLTHNLGRIPVGYLVMSKTAATDVYTGSISATATQITLRATGTNVDINLFIV